MSNPFGEMISAGEGNYNSYNRGTTKDKNGKDKIVSANQVIDFSQMTIGEPGRRQGLPISDPDRVFAVGKYRLIPDTLDKEGARPSSLVAVRKPNMRDPLHELQLLRDLKIINERTANELGPCSPGGLAIQVKRKPEHANPGGSRTETEYVESEANRTNEEESMKASHLVAIVALATGTLSCQPASSTATTTDKESQAQNMAVPPMRPASTQPAPSRAVTQASKPQLGPEYKKIGSFAEFRKKLLADGWEPVVNPKCHEEMLHDEDYEDTCSGHSDDIYCRACDMLPEIVAYTAQGYLTTRYIKEGVPLSILSYGNISDFDQADRKEELIVRAWDYTNWD